jgi:hypothetical protein
MNTAYSVRAYTGPMNTANFAEILLKLEQAGAVKPFSGTEHVYVVVSAESWTDAVQKANEWYGYAMARMDGLHWLRWTR